MKRRIIGAGTVILVIALVAIFGWYLLHTQSTQAELNRAIADYETKKQPVTVSFVVTAPQNTPADQVLYLSGSVPALGNWDAAGVALTKSEDGKYHCTVPELLNGMDYSYKITRGTWGTVESDANGKDVKDVAFTAGKDGKVEHAVANWLDNGQAVPGRVTMTGDIRVMKNAIPSKLLGNPRTVAVYLPPDYEKNAQSRYPVLYLNDGQNLFDEATSYQGIEWKLDEAAQKLIADGKIKPVIIVGVYNAPTRNQEFTPPLGGASASEAKGNLYAQMIVEEIKPFIDQRYRTLTDKPNTAIGGGSMGGLIALYTAKTQPNAFGAVIALSPQLRIADKSVVSELIGDGAWLKGTKLYLDMGTNPGHNYSGDGANAIPDAQAFVAALEKAGLALDKDFSYQEIEGGKHNESSWSATAEQVLTSMYGTPQPAPATSPAAP